MRKSGPEGLEMGPHEDPLALHLHHPRVKLHEAVGALIGYLQVTIGGGARGRRISPKDDGLLEDAAFEVGDAPGGAAGNGDAEAGGRLEELVSQAAHEMDRDVFG